MTRLSSLTTEQLTDAGSQVDELPARSAAQMMLDGQVNALVAMGESLEQIVTGATLMAKALRIGGKLVYAAAGSSALMACADGLELNGTYGISTDKICLLMAGGLPTDASMPGHHEDDQQQATSDIKCVNKQDVVIVVTASGRTPYTVACASAAQARGAKVIGVANNSGATLFSHADVAICLPTANEVVAGSTRMAAATAQKAALNMMSTLMAIKLGHVFGGMMVNLVADNQKLRQRAKRIVARIAACDLDQAGKCLELADGEVKTAAVMAATGTQAQAARESLESCAGNLRRALLDTDKMKQ